MLYLGHVARLPVTRPERIALFGWLTVEMRYNTNRRGSKSRRKLWKRLLELLALADIPATEAESAWEALANEDGGSKWNLLVKKWCKKQASLADEDTWLARHKDAAARGRTEAAEARVRQDLGARPVGGGKYACPHPHCLDPPVMQFPRSLRGHIDICKDLPHEVRLRQAEQRATKTGRQFKTHLVMSAPSSDSAGAAHVQPPDSGAGSSADPPAAPTASVRDNTLSPTRRRIAVKQARPLAFVQEVERSIAPCGDWDLGYLRSCRDKYAVRNPKRQMSLTDLPYPPRDWGTDLTCWWCSKVFSNNTALLHDVRACPSMPFSLWLRRIRVTQVSARHSQYTCCHCGTPFFTPKARGRHSVACASRRTAEGLPLNQERYIEDSLLERPPAAE